MQFTLSQNNLTVTAGNDIVTILAGSSRVLQLVEIKIDGLDLVSTANYFTFGRSTSGTTGGGALTPQATRVYAPAAVFTNFTSWSVQPTLAASTPLTFGLNTFGGKERWFALPSEQILIQGLGTVEQWSFRCVSGTGKISWTIVVDEL